MDEKTNLNVTKCKEAAESQSECEERAAEQIKDWEGEPDKLDRADIDYMIACAVLAVLGIIAIGTAIGFLIWYLWRR